MFTVTFPLSEEVFMKLDNIDQSEYNVDVSKIEFDDDQDENIESAFIYIRNLQLSMNLDFSNTDYNTKERWILKYLIFNMNINPIKILDGTILTILANEYVGFNCILTPDEVKQFRDNNKELVDSIINFLASLNVISVILLSNKENETIVYDAKELGIANIIENKPKFYECVVKLIDNYPNHVDGIRMFYEKDEDMNLYKYVIDDIQNKFDTYSAILKLPSIRFMEILFAD